VNSADIHAPKNHGHHRNVTLIFKQNYLSTPFNTLKVKHSYNGFFLNHCGSHFGLPACLPARPHNFKVKTKQNSMWSPFYTIYQWGMYLLWFQVPSNLYHSFNPQLYGVSKYTPKECVDTENDIFDLYG